MNLPDSLDLADLSEIQSKLLEELKKSEAIVHIYWRPCWNMNQVGRQWYIRVRIFLTEPLSKDYCSECVLHDAFPKVGWMFDSENVGTYDSFDNLNWNMNNAGFVQIK